MRSLLAVGVRIIYYIGYVATPLGCDNLPAN
jgi:hypothetical protein